MNADLPTAPTVGEIIERIEAATPQMDVPRMGDGIHTGDPATVVTGIVTTFLATHDVIRRTIELGANLIITHEPTFYGIDMPAAWGPTVRVQPPTWLDGDPVRAAKQRLLDDHGITIWSYHTGWHIQTPDGVVEGLRRALGWDGPGGTTEYGLPFEDFVIGAWAGPIPTTTVRDVLERLRTHADCATPWLIGDPDLVVSTGAVGVGWLGAQHQIRAFREADVTIVGEVHEWETSEYARDAIAQGERKALIVAGHAVTEEPGMAYLAEWLPTIGIEIPVTHVPAGDVFRSAAAADRD